MDAETFQETLDLENSQYAEETQIYTDLKNNYLRELGVTEEALRLVQSADLKSIHFWRRKNVYFNKINIKIKMQ